MKLRIRPYQRSINAQLKGDEAWPDFVETTRIIREYQAASSNDVHGVAELYVLALEVGANFMIGIGIHDVTYQTELANMVWEMVEHFNEFDSLYPEYAERLRKVSIKLRQSWGDEVIEPFYQLQADMDDFE